MKLSLNWLSKFLSLDEIAREEVASKLTMGSFEVEEIHKIGSKLKGPLVVGKILAVQQHPNTGKLSVCKVTTDTKNELQIVCGATNIKVGQLVAVSLPGACVVNRQDGLELHINTTKIKQIESHGMLCSPGELGISSSDPNSILILGKEAKVGENVMDYLSLKPDIVLEVASRSNRGDALSVYGLGKEISALMRKKLKEIRFKTPDFKDSVRSVPSKIEDTKDTYIFYTATIEDIYVSESPQWLKRLLESVEIRSINNIVDITNYINFTFGQPLHTYDRAKLNGFILTSRLAKGGEKIVTLDGKERILNQNILVIADEKHPVAIAGIMGAKESEVTETTKDIVIEAAVFNHARVRRGARGIGLSSEASKRFERGVDSNFTYNALLKTIELIEEVASSENNKPKVGKIYLSGEPKLKETKISLTPHEVKRVLGVSLSNPKIVELLELLHFKTKVVNEDRIDVTVPPHRRGDILRSIDLVEEVARLYGYDHIPAHSPPSTVGANLTKKAIEKVKGYFLASGFSETYISSLIGDEIINLKEFCLDKSKAISMINPLSKEHSVLRQSLIPGLLGTVRLNQSHQTSLIRLFEIGRVYLCEKPPQEKDSGVTESLKLAGLIAGIKTNWFQSQNFSPKNYPEYLFFTGKGILESFFINLKCQFDFHPAKSMFLHPSYSLSISLNKKDIGNFGYLHPQTEKKLELFGPIIVFEINLEEVLQEIENIKFFEKISSQPIVQRDITADLDMKHHVGKVTEEIAKVKSGFVTEVDLISVYELDKENRSLTYRFKMQDLEQTLTTKQIEGEVNFIKKHLTACFQAKFRV